MFILKISYHQDLRRIAFSKVPSFETLHGCVASMFVDVGNDFSIQYLDDEGDTISIKTDMELNEAFRVAQSQQNSEPYIVRLYVGGVEHLEDSVVLPQEEPAQTSDNSSDVNEENVINNFEKQISLLLSVVQKIFY